MIIGDGNCQGQFMSHYKANGPNFQKILHTFAPKWANFPNPRRETAKLAS